MGFTEPALYDSDEDLASQLLKDYDLDRLRAEGFLKVDKQPVPAGKLQFVSARAEAAGHDPLPTYTPPADPGDGLVLISAASHYFLNSTFGANPELRRRAGDSRITIHPDDAITIGIVDGTPVLVANDRGSFEAVVEVSDKVRPGVAATTKGRWAKFNKGATVNATVAERDSDFDGGAVFHDNRVRITPR